MSLDEKVKAMGIDIEDFSPSPTLAPATRIGNTIYCSGHVSTGYVGKLGAGVDVETGKKPRESARKTC